MQWNVLNPRGRDPEQQFVDGAGTPTQPGHAPINFHAYAACTRGAFHVDTKRCIDDARPVLVLIRHRLRQTLRVVTTLRDAGVPCYVCWKETGLQQVAAQLGTPARLNMSAEIVRVSDGVITPNDELIPLYEWAAAGQRPVHFVPTPYPVNEPQWDSSRALAERDGIFIGTRTFRHLYRTHLSVLALAARLVDKLGCRLTVINTDGRDGLRMIEALNVRGDQLNVAGPLPYAEYLRLMAAHRVVLQWDLGAVPGQVAGDALLCRMPCVGGNGMVERLAFPELCGGGRSGEELGALAARLLSDDDAWHAAVKRSRHLAAERLSFPVVAQRLQQILPGADD